MERVAIFERSTKAIRSLPESLEQTRESMNGNRKTSMSIICTPVDNQKSPKNRKIA